MFEIIGKKDIQLAFDVLYKDIKAGRVKYRTSRDLDILRDNAMKEAQKNHTLKQVIEWGDEDCPHRMVFETSLQVKRECPDCWAELQKEVESG